MNHILIAAIRFSAKRLVLSFYVLLYTKIPSSFSLCCNADTIHLRLLERHGAPPLLQSPGSIHTFLHTYSIRTAVSMSTHSIITTFPRRGWFYAYLCPCHFPRTCCSLTSNILDLTQSYLLILANDCQPSCGQINGAWGVCIYDGYVRTKRDSF